MTRPILSGFLAIAVLMVFLTGKILAVEPNIVRESIRARGMGNAFTAVAEGPAMLFYNPAGLAQVEETFFELLSVGSTINQGLIDIADETDPAIVFDMLVGKKMHLEADLSLLSLYRPWFGYSLFNNVLTDLEVHSPTLPFLDVRAYIQQGIIGGYGYPTSPNLDLGYGFKFIKRKGVFDRIHLTHLGDIDEIDSFFQERSEMGFDFGWMYHISKDPTHRIRWGLMINNIGGMNFEEAGGQIPTTYDTGLAYQTRLRFGTLLLAADLVDFTYKNTEFKSPARNAKLGVEIAFGDKLYNDHHLIYFRFGRNGTYDTYGMTLNLWGFMLDYAKWSEEYGRYGGDKEDVRQGLQATLLF